MKVLCITSSYPRFEGDIAGHFVAELNALLSDKGHSVQTLAWSGEHTRDRKSVEFVRYAPRRFESLFFRSGAFENLRDFRNRLLIGPAILMMWRRIVKREKPDLVIGHWVLPSGFLARMAGDFWGIPSCIIGHSGGLDLLKNLKQGSAIRNLVLDGSITVPSSAFFDLVPNGDFFPVGFHSSAGRNSKKGYKREGVLIMSRLEKIKNVERVIQAWRALKTPPTLHIAGDGSQRNILKQLAKDNPHIDFHGYVVGDKKTKLLLQCRYFFLSSKILDGRHEGFPIALLQAIDAGLIPLVSYFPGVEDILTPRFIVHENESWATRFLDLDRAFKQGDFKGELLEIQNRVEKRKWSILGLEWVKYFEGLA